MRLYRILPWLLQAIVWIPTRLGFIFFSSIKIQGLHNIKHLKAGVIFASNHANASDVVILPGSLTPFSQHFPIFYVSRERSFYNVPKWKQLIFFNDFYFKSWGAYKAHVGKRDYNFTLSSHIKILEDGGSVLIFPEGRTTKDGSLGEAKAGVAFLCHRTGSPVVPIAISGNFKMSKGSFLSRKHKLTITFGTPRYRKELFLKFDSEVSQETYKAVASIIMDDIKNLLSNEKR